jgi:hypothetical protein
MPYPAFDRSRLRIQPLAQRQHDLDLSVLLPLDAELPPLDHPALPVLGRRLVQASIGGGARILLMALASSVAMSLTVGLPSTWESARKEASGATTIPR